MYKMMAVIVLVSLDIPAFAQRFPLRFHTLNPLAAEATNLQRGEKSWMHSLGAWGEFAGYRMVRDDEHAWVQRLGAYFELLRVGNTSSLAFLSDIEFIANPDNDIRFNPRAIFWEEGFLFTQRTGDAFWQAGYFHRCKHDIDNYLLQRERSLIFGSLYGAYLLPWGNAHGDREGLVVLRTDIYTIRQDDRLPLTTRSELPNLKRILATIGASVHIRQPISPKHWGIYGTSWSMVNLYGQKEGILNRFDGVRSVLLNGGVSAGIALQGKAHMRFGFSYEYLSDTGINPHPESAHLVTIGVTLLNPEVLW